MTKRSALLQGAIALVLVLLIGTAAMADDDNPIEEQWPEEVPTPWFCVGWPPNDVCVPPW